MTWSPGSASVTCLRATPGHTDVTAHKADPRASSACAAHLLMGQDSHFVQPRGRETLQQPVLFTSVKLGVEYAVSCVPCPYLFLPHRLRPTVDERFSAVTWVPAPPRSAQEGDCPPAQGSLTLSLPRGIVCYEGVSTSRRSWTSPRAARLPRTRCCHSTNVRYPVRTHL